MTTAGERERQVAELVLEGIGRDGASSDHQLVVGGDTASNQRVLDHVEQELRRDPSLRNRRTGFRIADDEDRPTSLAHLWARAVDEMVPQCDDENLRKHGKRAVRDWQARDRPPQEWGLEALALTMTATRSDRTVLLIEGIDELWDALGDDRESLETVLESEPSIVLVGTATSPNGRFNGMTVQHNESEED